MAKHGFSIIVLSWALMGPQAWFGVMVAGVGSLDNPGSIGSVRAFIILFFNEMRIRKTSK